MHEISADIPDVEQLLASSADVLGAKLLLRARSRFGNKEFHLGNLASELWPQTSLPGHQSVYPRERRKEIDLALTEAWAWLQSKGWIVPYSSAGPGWMQLSRRALLANTESEIIHAAEKPPRDTAHGVRLETAPRAEFNVDAGSSVGARESAPQAPVARDDPPRTTDAPRADSAVPQLGPHSIDIQMVEAFLTALDEQDSILLTVAEAHPNDPIPIPQVTAIKGIFDDILKEFPGLIREFEPHGKSNALRAQIRAARSRLNSRIHALRNDLRGVLSTGGGEGQKDDRLLNDGRPAPQGSLATSAQADRIISALIDRDDEARSGVIHQLAISTSFDFRELAERLRAEISGRFSPQNQNLAESSTRDPTLMPSIRSWMFSALILTDAESDQTRSLVSRHLRAEFEPARNVRFWILAGLFRQSASYLKAEANTSVTDQAPEVAALAQAIVGGSEVVRRFREMLLADFAAAWPVLRVLRVVAIRELAADVSALFLNSRRGSPEAYDSLFALCNLEMAEASAPGMAVEPGVDAIVPRVLEEGLQSNANARREFAVFLSAFEPETVERALAATVGDSNMQTVAQEMRRFLSDFRREEISAGPYIAGFSSESLNVEDDRLDIRQDVQTLTAVMLAREVIPPLAIGLFGDWGSGKSFFMRSMRVAAEDLARRSRGTSDSRFCKDVVSIEFNAWHYVDTNLWASLVSYILDQLGAFVTPEATIEERQTALHSELHSAKTAREEARNEKEVAENAIKDREAQLELLRRTRREKEVELKELRLADFRTLIAGDTKLKREIETSLDELGVPPVLNGIADLTQVVSEAYTLRGRTAALLSQTFSRNNLWFFIPALLLILAVIPFITWWLSTKPFLPFFAHASPVALQIGTAISALSAILAAALKKSKEYLGTLELAKQRVENLLAAKRKEPSAPETTLQSEISTLRSKEERAASILVSADARVLKLEEKIRTLENAQSLAFFLQDRAGSDDYRKHLGLISVIRQDFESLAKRLSSKIPSPGVRPVERIILFIDDLDRCPASKVMDVLQAVHLLLAYPLFVVVVGVDPRWLLHSLREAFPTLRNERSASEAELWETTPQNYLEKIFQIPFNLRQMTPSGYARLMDSLLTSGASGQTSVPQPARDRIATRPGIGADGPGSLVSTPGPPSFQKRQDEPEEVSGDQDPEPEFIINEEALVIKPWEKDFSDRLFPLVHTPRVAKRFSNIYRILKAPVRREDLHRFEGTPEILGDFQLPMLLLAILLGSPDEASELFPKLHAKARGAGHPLKGLLDFASLGLDGPGFVALAERIQSIGIDDGFPKAPEIYLVWLPEVARFSFDVGREVQLFDSVYSPNRRQTGQ